TPGGCSRDFEEIFGLARRNLPPGGLERANLRNVAGPEEAARSRRFGSRLDAVEVLVEDARELLAVAYPVRARGGVLQAGYPVDVELVDGGVDSVTLQPALAERPRVPERLLRAPLGEPRVLAEERLQHLHAVEVAGQLDHGRPADVQLAVPVVVQLQ